MKTRLLAAFAMVLVLLVSAVQGAVYTKFEAITVANTAIGLTAANINNTDGSHVAATVASCRLETAQVRWTIDSTTPTSSVGTLLEIGDTLILNGNDVLNNFRAIRTGATSGKLNCHEMAP